MRAADLTALLPLTLLFGGVVAGCGNGPDASDYCEAFCEESFGDPDTATSVGALPYRGSPFAERTYAYCVEVRGGAAPSPEDAATFHTTRLTLVGALDGLEGSDPPPDGARRALLTLRALTRNTCGRQGR